MWVRYLKQIGTIKPHSVAWAEDDVEAQALVDDGILARCTGPDGKSLEEDAPENVITQLAKEAKMSFKEIEDIIQQRIKDKRKRIYPF